MSSGYTEDTHDSPANDRIQKIGGKAETGSPSAVADADAVQAHFDEYGKMGVMVGQDGSTSIAVIKNFAGDGGSNTDLGLLTKAMLAALAPDGNLDRLRTVSDAAPGLGVLAVGTRSPDASEVKTIVADTPSPSTTRSTLLTPTSGKKVRIIGITVVSNSASVADIQIYFGTGATYLTTPANAIAEFRLDNVDLPSASIVFPDGGGPVGAVDAVVSVITDADITTGGSITLIYREE